MLHLCARRPLPTVVCLFLASHLGCADIGGLNDISPVDSSGGRGGNGASEGGAANPLGGADAGSGAAGATSNDGGSGATRNEGGGGSSSTDGGGGTELLCAPLSTAPCYTGAGATQNVGLCAAGTSTCTSDGMNWGACVGEILPTTEICGNGVDEDCDGVVDSGCALNAGSYHTCALTASNGLKCWGYNEFGQLGDGTKSEDGVPSPVPVTGLSSGVASVVGGNNHTCALTTTGAVKCWGDNLGYGQLGNLSVPTDESLVPVTADGLATGGAAISAGYYGTCALVGASAVHCWGLIPGALMSQPTPTSVAGLSATVTAIAVGYRHACLLTTGGGVQCWGENGKGQLGNNSTVDSATPIDIAELSSGIVAINAGEDLTCAIDSTGLVTCWGDRHLGVETFLPFTIAGLADPIVDIAVAGDHTCAVTNTGAVKCWGFNTYGQLGNNSTASSATPVDVVGLSSGVTSVTVGERHTCARMTTGAVRCWGDNGLGQLGNGSLDDSLTPVDVVGL